MIIYNPHNKSMTKERIKLTEKILDEIPAKYAFISGSFLFKEKYKDIDLFVISRTKKEIKSSNKKVKITIIDFNDLHSLFHHSVSKSCIAKNILPTKPLKATLSDYWNVVNESIPNIMNQKDKYQKETRFLVLYTEYFKNGNILDSFQLNEKIKSFRNHKEILNYVEQNIPEIMQTQLKKSYIKRFFYTQAGFYKELKEYKAQNFLYELVHKITRGING